MTYFSMDEVRSGKRRFDLNKLLLKMQRPHEEGDVAESEDTDEKADDIWRCSRQVLAS